VRALLTGVSGQDGSYLSERLLGDAWEVHALSRPGSVPGEQPIDPAVAVHLGDLGDEDRLRELIDAIEPDAIVNLGGISSVAASWQRPALTARVSGLAPVVILDAALRLQQRRGRSVRVLQASSAEIFGDADRSPQDESTPIRPVNPYGAAKALAHHSVGVFRVQGLAASSAILYNHESPRRPPEFVTRKITLGAARIAAGLQDTLSLGNLDARRDWGWAPDYVDAMARILTADDPDDFVVATGESHTVRDFVDAAFAAAGVSDGAERVTVDERFVRPTDAADLRGDASKARRVLGWQPTVGFEELVARMVRSDLESL
jgi:GDPmannose 4,6-dehydratase